MTETNVIFACDESGAKGYADKTEAYPGEVGVFAGILVPEECDAIARPEFQRIWEQYKPLTGKLHITDLPSEQQTSIRDEVYTAIRDLGLPCFWYAIHVAGLHDWYLKQQKRQEDANCSVSAAGGQSIKVGGNKQRCAPASMHEELFAGLYAHLVAFLEERARKEVSIEIRTDRIDSPIVKNFEANAKNLLSDAVSETLTGWDVNRREVVKGILEVQVALPQSLDIEVSVRKLSISAIPDGDGYVLAADILANSLNHLFKNRGPAEIYTPLNCVDAIADHPIADHLATFRDWGNGDLIGDKLYSHPKSGAYPEA